MPAVKRNIAGHIVSSIVILIYLWHLTKFVKEIYATFWAENVHVRWWSFFSVLKAVWNTNLQAILVLSSKVLGLLVLAGILAMTFIFPNRPLYVASGLIAAWSVGYYIRPLLDEEDLASYLPSCFIHLVLFLPAVVGFYMPLKVADGWEWYCYLRPLSIIKSKSSTANSL